MTQNQGLSLLDIAPLTEQVPVGDSSLQVTGISVEGIVLLFQRFPEVKKWFGTIGQNIQIAELAKETPGAIAAIIAAGCGHPGNQAAEEVAKNLPIETQLDILEAIGRLTFKNGFGPFVQRIVALSEQARSVNFGRPMATKSPQVSKPSLPPATTQEPSGN